LQAFRIQPKATCQFVDQNYVQKTFEFFQNVKNSVMGPKKPVVFLQHGLLSSADTWIINSETLAPAFVLANKGYDVWLGNQRGTKYSRRHETLDPDKMEDLHYWDFSFVEMGMMDAPAQIDHILKITG
jgi:lysosomal acid lipase/cholesteryl ester hydrolase